MILAWLWTSGRVVKATRLLELGYFQPKLVIGKQEFTDQQLKAFALCFERVEFFLHK
jgi:hypothetical protein